MSRPTTELLKKKKNQDSIWPPCVPLDENTFLNKPAKEMAKTKPMLFKRLKSCVAYFTQNMRICYKT